MTIKYIIKLSPEITIKSKPVRLRTITLLRRNIKNTLLNEGFKYKLDSNWDSIELKMDGEYDKQKLEYVLKNIFGIQSFQEVQSFEFETKEDIKKIVLEYYQDKISNKSFFVRVKRFGTHDFRSPDLEKFLGAAILINTQNAKVTTKNPDYFVKVEIKHNILNLVINHTFGAGGYPIGFSGKVLSLISGGFDSSISSYLSMKRGLKTDFLFFDLGFKPQEIGVKQISYYLRKNFGQSYKASFIKIDFSFLVKLLIEHSEPRFRSVLLKRYMLKTIDLLNPYFKEKYEFYNEEYDAIVKGDSLAQVSSQTLANLKTIDCACDMLVLRPLLTYDKEEIINFTRKIGTYDFSVSMPEYCGVVSDNPSTKARLDQIEGFEKEIDKHFYSKVLENIEITKINKVLDFKEKNLEINIVSEIKENDVVVDIREKDKITKNPIDFGVETLQIPFYDINSRFEKLDKDKNYLFYCEKGVLSKLHYLYLKERGYSNISVYRPE